MIGDDLPDQRREALALFLGERPQWTALAGLAFILSGIALAETKGRKFADGHAGVKISVDEPNGRP